MAARFVLDFDNTMFDTTRLWNRWRDDLVALGFDEATIRACADTLIPEGFTPQEHTRRLGVGDEHVDRLAGQLDVYTRELGSALLFPDVLPFVRAHTPVSLLTFGDHGHQMSKITATGLHEHLDDIRITQRFLGKAHDLRAMLDAGVQDLVFIDDSTQELQAVHESGLPVTLMRMRRPGMRRSIEDHSLDHVAWQVVESLDDLTP